jgi:hypothetical protein
MTQRISFWQRDELEKAWRAGYGWEEAAIAAHVSLSSVQRWFAIFKAEWLPRAVREQRQVHALDVPADVLADRDRRAQLAPRDLVGWLAGDPLPGYSALEAR